MATIYKVEMELCSEYINYNEDELKDVICCWIDKQNEIERGFGSELKLDFDKFKVKRQVQNHSCSRV